MTGSVTREQVERLFENLPISFQVRKDAPGSLDDLNEALEVYVRGAIVYVYPPRHRITVCTFVDSSGPADAASRMRVGSLMDMSFPGHGQVRTSVYVDPAIFGIRRWPGTEGREPAIELDIHVYPKDKVDQPRLDLPSFGKSELVKFLELIAGGDHRLTVSQLREWRGLIMFLVLSMRGNYERPDMPEDYRVRQYYKPHWEEIAAAGTDEELVRALHGLVGAIRVE